jgi:hypothetical protein
MNSTPSVSRNFAGSPAAAETGSPVELRARRFFLLNMMLGSALLIAAAVTVGSGVGSIHAVSSARASHFTLAGLQFSRPYLNLAAAPLLALALVGLGTLVRGLMRASAEALSSRRFLPDLLLDGGFGSAVGSAARGRSRTRTPSPPAP